MKNNYMFRPFSFAIFRLINPDLPIVYNYMFQPLCWPSSGCELTYRAAIQDVWGVLLGYWGLGGGTRSRFNSEYHDVGLQYCANIALP